MPRNSSVITLREVEARLDRQEIEIREIKAMLLLSAMSQLTRHPGEPQEGSFRQYAENMLAEMLTGQNTTNVVSEISPAQEENFQETTNEPDTNYAPPGVDDGRAWCRIGEVREVIEEAGLQLPPGVYGNNMIYDLFRDAQKADSSVLNRYGFDCSGLARYIHPTRSNGRKNGKWEFNKAGIVRNIGSVYGTQ